MVYFPLIAAHLNAEIILVVIVCSVNGRRHEWMPHQRKHSSIQNKELPLASVVDTYSRLHENVINSQGGRKVDSGAGGSGKTDQASEMLFEFGVCYY